MRLIYSKCFFFKCFKPQTITAISIYYKCKMTTQEIIKKIIDDHGGYALFAEVNKSRLSGMIGDYFPHDPKMCKMLRFAVNENMACRLLKVKDSGDAPLEIKKLKFYLHDECGLDERIASQVVDCFAFALGMGLLSTKQ